MSDGPVIVGLGELLWDCFPDARRPGGAPANFAYHTQQLGARGLVASRVGQDADGAELREFLERKGLETSLISVDDRYPTGRVTVTLQDGQPEYIIHEDVAWDHLAMTPEWLATIPLVDAICFGSLGQRSPESRAAIHRALDAARPDCLIVCDVNLRQHWYDREGVEASLRRADLVKLNDAEVVTLSTLLGGDGATPSQFAQLLHQTYGVETVCMTRGSAGCWVSASAGEIDVPGEPVRVADTVGAGDSFTAAFVVSLLNGKPLETAARVANRVGGLVASRPGGMPDIQHEAQRILQSTD